MAVMDWPDDLVVAVIELLSGRDPQALSKGLEELRSFAIPADEGRPGG